MNLNLTPKKSPLSTFNETDTMMTIKRELEDSTVSNYSLYKANVQLT